MTEIWLIFDYKEERKLEHSIFLQAKKRDGGPSPIRTPTNLLKIDQNRLLYCNRQ